MTAPRMHNRLVTVSDIATIAGVSSSAVSNWRKRDRNFPAPAQRGSGGHLFNLLEVVEWLENTGRPFQLASPTREGMASWLEQASRHVEPTQPIVAALQVLALQAGALRKGSNLLDELTNLDPDPHPHNDEGAALAGLARAYFEPSWETVSAAFTPMGVARWLARDESDEIVEMASTMDGAKLDEAAEYLLSEYRIDRTHSTALGLGNLLLALIGPLRESLLDPAAGGGAILREATRRKPRLRAYGQELNRIPWTVATLSLLLNEADFDLRRGDSIAEDAFPATLVVDAVVVDPPLGADLNASIDFVGDDRWVYGDPNTNTMDLAWVQHACSHLSATGNAAIVVATVCLESDGRDEEARHVLLEMNWIDAVIELPSGLVAGSKDASIVLCTAERSNREGVLFIDAGQIGTPRRGRPRDLEDSDIEWIVDAVAEWRSGKPPSESRRVSVTTTDAIQANHSRLVPHDYIEYTARRTHVPTRRGNAERIDVLTPVLHQQLRSGSDRVDELLQLTSVAIDSLANVVAPDSWPTAQLAELLASDDVPQVGRRIEAFTESWDHPDGAVSVQFVDAAYVRSHPIVATWPSEVPGWTLEPPVMSRASDVIVTTATHLLFGEVHAPDSTTIRYEDKAEALHSDVLRLRVNDHVLVPEFFSLFIQSRAGADALRAADAYGRANRISLRGILGIDVPVPDLAVQRAIVDSIGQLSLLESATYWSYLDAKALRRHVAEGLINQIVRPPGIEP